MYFSSGHMIKTIKNIFFNVCQDSMGRTVRITSMTALGISVLMVEPVWMESTPTTVSALQSGLVRERVLMCVNSSLCVSL